MTVLPQPRFASFPLFTLAGALAVGVVANSYFPVSRTTLLFFAILTAASIGFVAWLTFAKYQTAATALVVFLHFLAGFSLSASESLTQSPNRLARFVNSDEPVEITGVIERQPERAPDRFYLLLSAERIRVKGVEREVSGRALLLAHLHDEQSAKEYEQLELRYGARIRVMTIFDEGEDYRNPGVTPFNEYLQREGYDASGVIKSPLLVERLEDERVFLPLAWLYEWREGLQRQFHILFSPETAGVLDASLLGNQHSISLGAAERFRAGGTFHILVISGLQIAFIGGLVLVMVRWFTRRKLLQVIFSAGLLWAYTIAVGADASVARSAFMFTVVLLAPVVSRRANTLNCLGGAAIALLVWRPAELFDPSFQLTFLSVLSIVSLAVPLVNRMHQIGSWRPTHATPYPPDCARWFRISSEALFWSESEWKAATAESNVRYRLFKTPWAQRLERCRLQKLFRFATNAIVISASVQIGMLPVLIIYFHRVSISALVLNIFVGALMALLILVASAAMLVSIFNAQLALPLRAITEKIDWLMIHSVDPFTRLGIDSLRLPHYRGWMAMIYVLYFLILGFLVLALTRWKPLRLSDAADRKATVFVPRNVMIAAAGFILLAMLILSPVSANRPDGKFHVDFLDVGQGDSALLTMPDGTTLLIDGGGRPSMDWLKSIDVEAEDHLERDTRGIGERVVSEYLWTRGLDHIDYVLATHADADHINGLNDVVRNFKVRAAIVARTPVVDPGFKQFANTARQNGVPVQMIGAGDMMRFGDVTAQVLWPRASADQQAQSRNNDSAVLRFKYGEKSILFTGDTEKEAELTMLTEGLDLKADVVKVAHHGSKTSSVDAFVNATRPSLAVISVGRSSIFGHPNRDVVERWRASGAEVMTTGEKGTISIDTDGRTLNISTFVRP